MKKYIIIAGVNGVGKSTLYQTNENLKNIPRVNVDEIIRTTHRNPTNKTTLPISSEKKELLKFLIIPQIMVIIITLKNNGKISKTLLNIIFVM